MSLDAVLLMIGPLDVSEPLSWLVVLSFLAAAVVERWDRELARRVAVAGWGLFGLFWFVLIPHFIFEIGSIVEGVGSIAAAPMSLYAGYRLWNGRDSLFVLTRAVGLMGLLYLPFVYVPFIDSIPARKLFVETVASQTAYLMSLLGYEPTLVDGLSHGGFPITDKQYPDKSTFVFEGNSAPIRYTIVTACTGVGSMSIIAGSILAVSAPLKRKMRALAIAIPIIYGLNLIRNVFIAVMFGHQRMQFFVEPIMTLIGTDDPQYVSYFLADRMIAQFGSVFAMVLITWLVVKTLPEILTIVEDLLYLLTGSEYELEDAFGVTSSPSQPQAEEAGAD
jgi:archaeosortase A (PGF-CTERM-specific)